MPDPTNADRTLAEKRELEPNLVMGLRLQRLHSGPDYKKEGGEVTFTPEGLAKIGRMLDEMGLPELPEKEKAPPQELDVIIHSKRANQRFLQVRHQSTLFDCEVRNNRPGVLNPGSRLRVRDTGRAGARRWACITPGFNSIAI